MINLISDTITRPDRPMLEAMMTAEVGDDVFGEDPTVRRLEEKVADLFGKEDALFCPSGTMSNQIAIKVHTRPMDELICDHWSHVYLYEIGGYAFHSGIAVHTIVGDYGKITANQVSEAIKDPADWLPHSRLVVLENSTNKGGGNYYTVDEIKPIAQVCSAHNLALHLDGARIFNVLVETEETPADAGRLFDSISVCLSKGLGAPVGSVLTGQRDFIKEARRVRKVMGGGMRQAGYLAAAGIYALDHNIPQLKTDNNRAKAVGHILSQLPYVKSVSPVKTNIVIFELSDPYAAVEFIDILKRNNIIGSAFGKHMVRLVFHRDISEQQFNEVMAVLPEIRV
ncbi:MAG: aminotransferase class I/II-fold pyridoxal phosphate-dependent enzyme [Saprospiraceae bacterium]|nr:aminotransferase class I/II-fold pyridoxal phosphate-dependent enzyme [Saprospiraceae bacterium]